jgi:agmatine/peptidylarginine deiminase
MNPNRLRLFGLLILLVAMCFPALSKDRFLTGGHANELRTAEDQEPAAQGPDLRFCMPGEFERQQAILVASGRLATYFPETLTDIAQAVRGRVLLVALVDSDEEESLVGNMLRPLNLADDNLRAFRLALDTQWIRDYGPLFVRGESGQIAIVDATYQNEDRRQDDGVPQALGKAVGIPVVQLPLVVEGGNLLSNGKGLFLTTSALLCKNDPDGTDDGSVREQLASHLGCEHLVVLDPLVGEPTGHVDMFATFTDSQTVVLAACDSEADPVNAALLDGNAARLAAVPPPYGPLRVVRIPMPPHIDGVWRTYNNVIFANGALLMPTYGRLDRQGERIAAERFEEMLPGWQIVPIDASALIRMDGALHCISMNVPADR